MAVLNPYQQYKQQSILTASKGELTLLLYNGCIKFIKQSKMMLEKNDVQATHDANIRAQQILEEFMATLDMKYGVSKNLKMIYEYLHRRLVEANIEKNMEILDEVLGFVTELRDNWEEVLKTGHR